jgi:hypothetical protein
LTKMCIKRSTEWRRISRKEVLAVSKPSDVKVAL